MTTVEAQETTRKKTTWRDVGELAIDLLIDGVVSKHGRTEFSDDREGMKQVAALFDLPAFFNVGSLDLMCGESLQRPIAELLEGIEAEAQGKDLVFSLYPLLTFGPPTGTIKSHSTGIALMCDEYGNRNAPRFTPRFTGSLSVLFRAKDELNDPKVD